MITDSIANASDPMPASKDFAKKKRGNRTAKLKQCKLDARREQWLSQVKKKGCKEEEAQAAHVDNEVKKREMKNLEIKPTDGVNECSDSDLPSNSPSSHVSSSLGSNVSGTNFTASSTSGSCSGSVSGEDGEAEEDNCFDDWEAMADASAASDDKQEEKKLKPELTNHVVELSKPKIKKEHVEQLAASGRAWKPDDAFRPHNLPNLAKQKSNYGCLGGVLWACTSVVSAPKSCPICCEDLDYTDSSFIPCGCGFRLCLFCHKRILEEDGRCPGCRKPYEFEKSSLV